MKHIGHARFFQLGQHLQPKLRSLGLTRPQPQHFLVALHVDTNDHVIALVADVAGLANSSLPERPDTRSVYRIQRPALPVLDLLHHCLVTLEISVGLTSTL